MGGNIEVDGVRPSKLDFERLPRGRFCDHLIDCLDVLNNEFAVEFDHYLWRGDLRNIFAGSSAHLFDENISDEEFNEHKRFVGDIDIKINEVDMNDLLSLLESEETSGGFSCLSYIGKSETSINQLSTLFRFLFFEETYIQIDFEPTALSDNPSTNTWNDFSHSSDWGDVKRGVKGVFHKYLLGCVDFAHQSEEIVMKGKKRVPTKEMVHMFAFSVSHGLRWKYKAFIDENLCCTVLHPTSVKDSYATKDLNEMFEVLFQSFPSKTKIEKMWSFFGLIELINENFDWNERKLIAEEFVKRTMGDKAQILCRDDEEMDFKIKKKAIDALMNGLGLVLENSRPA